jgi:hypothetical protein
MATLKKKRVNFLDSEQGELVRQVLESMTTDKTYNTMACYSPNIVQYPDNLMPFVDKHMNYLNAHPNLDANMYVSNLQLMTRSR